MAFLAVFALALSLAAGRLADRWEDELAQRPCASRPRRGRSRRRPPRCGCCETTPGVASARALTRGTAALLEPWFGPDLPLEALPMPR
jgi:cell division transport system permease protein